MDRKRHGVRRQSASGNGAFERTKAWRDAEDLRACESGVALRLPPQSKTHQPQRGGMFVVRAMKRNSSSVLVAVRKDRNRPPRRGLGIFLAWRATKISLLTELVTLEESIEDAIRDKAPRSQERVPLK
jgi:hypothetical protein